MKAATSSEIKQELKKRSSGELIDICLRLARFKKENKELITYLLFEAGDNDSYIASVKAEIDNGFEDVNTDSAHYAKKTLRKILRNTRKFARYSGDPIVEAELLLHYARHFYALKLNWRRSTLLLNIYKGVLKKLEGTIGGLHEDLQYEYGRQFENLKI